MTITAETLRKFVTYDYETGVMTFVSGRRAGKPLTTLSSTGYYRAQISGYQCFVHRLVWLYHHGDWPNNQIDHINGDRRDNRIENLRDVTHNDNHRNMCRRRNSKSKHAGVLWRARDKRWQASIGENGRHRYLGYFKTEEEAIAARKAAEARLGFHPNHGRAK